MDQAAASPDREIAATVDGPGPGLVFLVLLALTIVRLIGLHLSVVDFDVDEVQYWGWSQALSFGYFSKPPLIAWWDAAGGLVCGNGIACVRSPAPIAYMIDGLLIYGVARRLFDRRVGFIAALLLVLAPGITYSTRLMTTDVPLLLFWCIALYAFVRLRQGGRWPWAAVLGVAFGLGTLSKYAMIYFPVGMVAAAVLDPASRAVLKRSETWLWMLLGTLLLIPNLLWNLDHGLITFIHTEHYVAAKAIKVNPGRPFYFLLTQFIIAGPIVFWLFLLFLWRLGRWQLPPVDRLLLAFAVPPIVAIFVESAFASFFANWAATGFVTMFVFAAAVMVRGNYRWLIAVSLLVGLAIQGLVLGGDAFADRFALPFSGKNPNPYDRDLGWAELGTKVEALMAADGAASVATDDRGVAATLIYYLGPDQAKLYAWPPVGRPINHFQLTRPLQSVTPGPLLMIATCGTAADYGRYYAQVKALDPIVLNENTNAARSYDAFLLSDPKGTLGPVDDCS